MKIQCLKNLIDHYQKYKYDFANNLPLFDNDKTKLIFQKPHTSHNFFSPFWQYQKVAPP